MFSNFAWSEMLIIACVAIIVVGPKDLPGMLRGLGKTIGNVKRMANDFQKQFNDAIKEADLDDVADMAKNKTFAPLDDAKNAMDDFSKSITDPLNEELDMVDEIEAPAIAPAPKQNYDKPATADTGAKTKPASGKKAAPKRNATNATAGEAKTANVAKKPAPKRAAAKKPTPKTASASAKAAAKKPPAKKPAPKRTVSQAAASTDAADKSDKSTT